jgi:hypothetical protein
MIPVLILIILVITIVLFKDRLSSPLFIAGLIVAVLVVECFRYFNEKRHETFVEQKPMDGAPTVTIDDTLRDYGFSSIQALREFIRGDYNEDLTQIFEDNSLTLYYSVFSYASIPVQNTRTWKNISKYFVNDKTTCPNRPFEHTHLEFSEPPYVNKNVGLETLSNPLSGPLSHECGVQGNGTFSIFCVMRINGFSSNNSQTYDIFKLYGNTLSNNGVSLAIEPQPIAQTANSPNGPIPTHVFNAKMSVLFGSQTLDVSMVSIDTKKTYMFVATKTNKKITLTMHDMSSKTGDPLKLIQDAELTDPTVSFSNKAFEINKHGNLNANIYAFGMFNLYLVDETRLKTYMYNELFKTSDEFMGIARNILNMQQQIDQLKACPYNPEVCSACTNVDDWTDIQKVLATDAECKKAIDVYCSKNLDDPKCKCWDPLNKTNECKSYLNIFRQNNMFQVENIDVETLGLIKNKYGLCDCKEMDRLMSAIKPAVSAQNESALTSAHVKADPKDAAYYDSTLEAAVDANAQAEPKGEITKEKRTFWSWLFG